MEEQNPRLPEIKVYPFFIKATVVLFGLVLFCHILYVLSSVFVPFAFACLLAILLNPLNSRFEKKVPRGIAIFLTVLIALVLVVALAYFLSREMLTFSEALPALKAKFFMIGGQVQLWIKNNFGIETKKQVEIIHNALQGSEVYVGETLNNILDGAAVLVLLPIYIFFLLFYKPLILDFLFQAFPEKHSLRVAEILGETKNAIQSYVMGLLIEMIIVSAMNSAALLLLGVKSAVLIGVIGGILNVIPYLGGIVAIALPLLMVTITKDGYSTQLAILFAYLVIQMIDNNILVPKIVSSKVEINALFSILIVLCGGLLWGYSGMFLSIPFVAILKIIFDRIDGLKPWGHLLGTDIPEVHRGVKWQARWELKLRRQKVLEGGDRVN
ncbi:MAG: AI-2E family transporter [Flavipsychrobacter sp.]|nr:AI-2E family transporter [Flavipsychrobacter sp.]